MNARFAAPQEPQPQRQESLPACGLLPPIDPSSTLDQTFQTALRLHQAGQPQAARPLYERILQTCPTHAGAWHLLGVTWQQDNQPDQAAECISRALALDNSKPPYHNNYAVALRALGRLPPAQQALERALALQPNYPDAHANLGLVLQDQGQYSQAIARFQRALALQPGHADALFNLANLLQELGRRSEAIALYRQLLQQHPQHAGAHNNLGNALLAEHQTAPAIAAYQQALTLQPAYAEAQLNLATAYAEAERLSEATECPGRGR